VTAQERVGRNAEVFNARARGWSWPTIAAQFNLSERQCRRVVAEYREATGSLADLDASEIVRDTLEAYDAAIEDLALLADETAHDGTKLGAIRARLDAVKSRWELMQAIGVLPADLGQLWPEFDAARVARQIVDVLDNHQVSPEVQQEITKAVEQRHATSVDHEV
jgi:chorismate mutase